MRKPTTTLETAEVTQAESTVGAIGKALAEPLDLANMGFSFVGVSDGVDGDVGSGSIEDETDRLAFWVSARYGDYARAVALWPGFVREDAALPNPLVELGKHHIGPVDLIAGAAEILADRTKVGAPIEAVFQELSGLRLVCVGAGAGVFAQLNPEVRVDRSGFDEADQAVGEVRCLGSGGQPDGQPPGGEMIDDGAPAVSGSDAVIDQALVQRQVR